MGDRQHFAFLRRDLREGKAPFSPSEDHPSPRDEPLQLRALRGTPRATHQYLILAQYFV